ncbi:rod shape-determining protein [Helicobacter monodelphidis]|uniref:rod shape-determining protein n=1 Tax=Helicobacter sp. 15-1451 TaxID=2004995 RepID=UPI000DCEC48F|nr:rod shape-determining protein [Helicobacter sp. 15-1451]RAX57667.1 rod shape-determining protein [Helicobacter sp. 15-1451]
MFNYLNHFKKSSNIAVDLGTTNTIVAIEDEGVIFNEPSCIAVERRYGASRVVAIGKKAKAMRGKTHSSLEVISPLANGAISDFEMTKAFMSTLINILSAHISSRPRVGISIPQNLTQVERNSLYEATMLAGAREVILIEDPFSAAVGAGVDINSSRGRMIVDCGSGLTEVSIISLSGLVTSSCSKTAGDTLDNVILEYIKHEKNLLISKDTAEQIKIKMANLINPDTGGSYRANAKHLLNGLPVSFEITAAEVYTAIMPAIEKIKKTIVETIANIPPQIVPDIVEDGVIITGGGALTRGFKEYLEQELKLLVHLSPDPLQDISRGATEILRGLQPFNRFSIK